MTFSVFPSTVHKSLYRLADDSFRAAVMYGVSAAVVYVMKRSGKILTTLLNRPDIPSPMLYVTRHPMTC